VYGLSRGGLANLIVVVPFSVVWLYATLVLAERRSGYIIMSSCRSFSLVVPYIHMKGKGVGVTSRLGGSSGHFSSSGRCSDRRARALLGHSLGARTVEPQWASRGSPTTQHGNGSRTSPFTAQAEARCE